MSKSKSDHFKSSALIDDAEWLVIETEEGLKQAEASDHSHLPVCERPLFESTVGAFIMLNALFMALQLDLADSSTAKWPWMMIDAMFCCVFSSEIAFRIYCLGFCTYARQKKYLFDALLVALNIADSAIQLSGSDSTGLQAFSALRILRVFKIVKMLRIVRIIEDLHLIVIGLISAVKSLQWVALMLGLVVFIVAIVLKILVGNECGSPLFQESYIYHFGLSSAAEATEKCQEFWGNIPRSMYTLYQVTTLESWSQVIARPIWDVRPSYVILILGFQFLTTFGLLNIVVAAVVDGTMNSSDEFVVERKTIATTVSHLEIVRSIYERSSGVDGKVTAAKFIPLLAEAGVRRKLLTMDISYDDPSQIFRIIDSDGTGAITLTELTRGFMRMRGPAKSKDLLAVRSLVYRCHHEIIKEMTEIKQMESSVDTLSKTLAEDFRQMLAEERKQNRKQDEMMARASRDDSRIGMPLQQAYIPSLQQASPSVEADTQMFDHVAMISSQIDCLLSSISSPATTATSASPLPPSTGNGAAHKPTDLPASVTKAMDDFVQLEHSKQLQQFQQELETLKKWLELGPKGLQMQTCFKGDRGLDEECQADASCSAPQPPQAAVSCSAPRPDLRGVTNQDSERLPLVPPRLPPNAKKK